MINAAIIGVSGFGQVHYNDLVREYQQKRINITGATIINQETEKEKCDFLKSIGCQLFTDYNQMLKILRGEIDICFIPTGIALHAPMSIAALNAGANVYVEKPLAATVQETAAMRKAERETGKFIAVGYQSIYQPETRRIKEYILSGKIGQVHTLKTYGLWPRNAEYYQRNAWAGQLKSGNAWALDSPFNNALAHYLNLLSFYAGESFSKPAVIVSVQAGLFRAKPITSADTAWIKAVSADGKTLLFYVTHACAENNGPVTVLCGQHGEIEYNPSKTVVRMNNGTVEEFASTQNTAVRQNIMNALIDKLHGHDRFICSTEIAAAQTIICNGAHESSAIHQAPSEYVKLIEDDKGVRLDVITGIEDIILNAFGANRLPNKHDASWISCGEVVNMTGYNQFSGGKTESRKL
ncbi:MAG: Gfo/Idh/MocA family protein [Victivallaceae bacterium]